jgi:hypothetical protein
VRASTFWLRATIARSIAIRRELKPIALLTRGAVSSSIHRMSSRATKCHVGLRMCVRKIAPSAKALSTASSVALRIR